MTLTIRIQLLLASAALVATPAVAQDAPIVTAPPAQTTPAPAPAQQTPPPAAETPAPASGGTASPTTVRPEALEVRDDAREAAQAESRAASAARPARAERAAPRAAAPVRAAPDPAPAPAASAPPREVLPPPAAAVAVPPAGGPPTVASTNTTEAAVPVAPAEEQGEGTPIWPLVAILGLGALAILAFLALRRRRAEDEELVHEEPYSEQPVAAEPAYVAPEPAHGDPAPEHSAGPVIAPTPEPEVVERRESVVAAGNFGLTAPVIKPKLPPRPPRAIAVGPTAPAPIDAAPAAAAALPLTAGPEPMHTPHEEAPLASSDDVSVAEAEAEDVASLTAAAPVTDRPWLEFAMRPVRAGTSGDEALVEIELTVANAGTLPAEDVRISTFMLPAGASSDMDRLLTGAPSDSAVQSATIEPGEGTRIDATLALRKADIGTAGAGEGFTPVVVADARYRLPDGSEGRTAASFIVGRSDENGELVPFALDDRAMHEEIEARLYGDPARA